MATVALQLQSHAQTAIAKRRAAKAEYFAQMLFLAAIKAEDMARAREHEWAQLQEVAREHGKNYGTPGFETRRAILQRLQQLEAARPAGIARIV